HGLMPKGPPQEGGVAIRKTAVASARSAGMRKLRLRLSKEVLRQASSGPSAVSSSNISATGTFTRLKNGGPTVIFVPFTNSLSLGNTVPHKTVKQATRRMRLLNRKLDSRETSDSSLCSLFRCPRLRMKKNTQTASTRAIKTSNQVPIDDCAKACTELTKPLRVRNVPKMA